MLDGYTEQQRKNWGQSKIVVYENEAQLRQFIKMSQENKTFDGEMFFGRISKAFSEKIKDKIKIDVDTEGYNVVISAHEIRKIFKDHGNEAAENLRGQRAISEEDIVLIPKIVQNPDNIILEKETYRGKPVIKFIKTVNGRITIVTYISDKRHNLKVQTMYSGRKLA